VIEVGAEAARRDVLDLLDELERALAREREALAARDGDQLARCAQHKADLVRAVDTATRRWQASGGRLDQAGDDELFRRARLPARQPRQWRRDRTQSQSDLSTAGYLAWREPRRHDV